MAGVRTKPNRGGKYQGWYVNAKGEQTFFTGTRDRKETLAIARKFEDEHRLIRLGYIAPPSVAARSKTRSVKEMISEYLAWGSTQGGRNGTSWAPRHAQNRATALEWWRVALRLDVMSDFEEILPRIDKAVQALRAQGKSGKTIDNHVQALRAFSEWCRKRGYLEKDELGNLSPVDKSPKQRRRALSEEEIIRLLDASAPHRRLLWEVALVSGLRANELRNLSVHDLDAEHFGVVLRASWTKNRKDGFQPLPEPTIRKLTEFVAQDGARRLYARYCADIEEGSLPLEPLLYVPYHTARSLDEDLVKAGIPKETHEGKVDFHALRTAYVTFAVREGGIKEAQHLARHSDPRITMNVYARVNGRLRDATVNKIGRLFEKNATSMHQGKSEDEK